MRHTLFLLTCPSGDDSTAARSSYADVTERLLGEFGATCGVKFVSDTILSCRFSEHGVSKLISPEALEAAARERLGTVEPAARGISL